MDLEDARYYEFKSAFFYPWEDFSLWRLHSKELRNIHDHEDDDPMIPDDPDDDSILRDEETLYRRLGWKEGNQGKGA